MQFCIEIPPEVFSVFTQDYIWKPLSASLWVLFIGFILAIFSKMRRKSNLVNHIRLIYTEHLSNLSKLEDNLIDLENMSFPEIDNGGHIVRSITKSPDWIPFSKFSTDSYYLVSAIQDYNETRRSICLNELSDKLKRKQAVSALNFACNAYLKMLSIYDKKTYKLQNIKELVANDAGYSMKYYKVN